MSRLLKTNNFPEFTGRVCPALCEAACTSGLYGDPVTVRENELAVIENAYAQGLIAPRKPEVRTDKRVAIVGSGPSGLAAADQLNHRGHHVTVFERDDRTGGLLMYGIPNMKLEKSVVERKCDLMRAEGVEFVTNANIGDDVPAEQLLRDFDAVILCCGAKKPRDLNVPGRDGDGVFFAVDYLTAATRSLLEHDDSLVVNGDSAERQIRHADRNDAQASRRAKQEQSVAAVAARVQDGLRPAGGHRRVRTRSANL